MTATVRRLDPGAGTRSRRGPGQGPGPAPRARARGGPAVRPPRQGRPGVVPPRLHPVPARARLRQGAVDARPAAPDRRRPDRVRDRPADRGQPALVPPAHPRDVRQGRRRVDQLGRSLDRRGGPPRDRPARLPHGHPQHRPGPARARSDDAAPAGLRPRLPDDAARSRLRGLPGARDADRASQHRALLGRSRGRQDHGPDRRGREPAHGLLPRHPRGRAQDPAVGGGPGDRRRGPRLRDAGRRHPRASSARRPRSPRPASTTCASTATRS